MQIKQAVIYKLKAVTKNKAGRKLLFPLRQPQQFVWQLAWTNMI